MIDSMGPNFDPVNAEFFFEGAEKLLEIWFFDTDEDMTINADLRKIPRENIEEFLDLAQCKIIAEVSNKVQNSYVLSESSLFISKNRLILKTCGTTSLLEAFDLIIQLAQRVGFIDYSVFFSRRKFLCPSLQPSVHQCFTKEVNFLDKRCDDGGAYIFGPLNEKCWFLYMQESAWKVESQTLEIIMSDLDEDVMDIFRKENTPDATTASKRSGISGIFPDAKIADFLFEPCGYSVNGLLDGDGYFTIHITPEKEFSYVSFETNVMVESYPRLIRHVISLFRPKSFFFVLLSNTEDSPSLHKDLNSRKMLPDYRRKSSQESIINQYQITFGNFSRHPG